MQNTISFRQIRQAAIIEQAAQSEETARALFEALFSEYGFQESALMVFYTLTDEEMELVINRAFPVDKGEDLT